MQLGDSNFCFLLFKLDEKARKMKKAFCFDICSCHSLRQNLSTSDLRIASVTSVEKRELQEHFSASACGLSFKKISFSSLFPTSVTWEKQKSAEDKFFLRVAQTNIETKYYYKQKKKILITTWSFLLLFFVSM